MLLHVILAPGYGTQQALEIVVVLIILHTYTGSDLNNKFIPALPCSLSALVVSCLRYVLTITQSVCCLTSSFCSSALSSMPITVLAGAALLPPAKYRWNEQCSCAADHHHNFNVKGSIYLLELRFYSGSQLIRTAKRRSCKVNYYGGECAEQTRRKTTTEAGKITS